MAFYVMPADGTCKETSFNDPNEIAINDSIDNRFLYCATKAGTVVKAIDYNGLSLSLIMID